jgi:hypothetical protein
VNKFNAVLDWQERVRQPVGTGRER